eukprot:scaffold251398_cov31-Tisochrysis_lutea.AAC.3
MSKPPSLAFSRMTLILEEFRRGATAAAAETALDLRAWMTWILPSSLPSLPAARGHQGQILPICLLAPATTEALPRPRALCVGHLRARHARAARPPPPLPPRRRWPVQRSAPPLRSAMQSAGGAPPLRAARAAQATREAPTPE